MKFIIMLFTSVSFYEFLLSVIAIIIGIYSTNYSIKHADLEHCIADLIDARMINDSYLLFEIAYKQFSNIKFEYSDIIFMNRHIENQYHRLYFYMKNVNTYCEFIKSNFYSKFNIMKYRLKIIDDLSKLHVFSSVLIDVRSRLRDDPNKNDNTHIRKVLKKLLKGNIIEHKHCNYGDISKSLNGLDKDLQNYENGLKRIHSKTFVGRVEMLFHHLDFITTVIIIIIIIVVIIYELYMGI